MRPILFEIFGWEVPSWHFFFVLAAFTAYFFTRLCAQIAARAAHRDASFFLESLPTLFVVCYIAGWFGARALSIFVEQLEVQSVSDFFHALFQIGPMTFYGGAFAAVLFGCLYCKIKGISVPFALGCGMVGGVFALGVGRIGCHLNGDDYGLPISDQANPPWWAVRFPNLEDGGMFRYPVQLEETFASFVIGCLGLWMFRRAYALFGTDQPSEPQSTPSDFIPAPSSLIAGRIGAWMALLSAAHRFFNEAFRGDPRGLFPGTQISTSSGIAVLICVFCALFLSLTRYRVPPHSRIGAKP
jgi:prolipoprotein diacylglyceryltransferase